MNYYALGSGIVVGLGIILTFVSQHRRISLLESQLLVTKQEVTNASITANIHNLTDDALKLVTESEFGPVVTEPAPVLPVGVSDKTPDRKG